MPLAGEHKREYNEFEREIDDLVGDWQQGYGLSYFYHQLNDTFTKSEEALSQAAQKYNEAFQKEDVEVRATTFRNDPNHDMNSAPPLHTLRKAHFITAHSEFEMVWERVDKIFSIHTSGHSEHGLNYNYIKQRSFSTSNILHKIVDQYQVLLTYNFLRNRIVHGKAKTTSDGYPLLLQYISSGELQGITTEANGTEFSFTIDSITFNKGYTKKVLEFLEEIVNSLYLGRNS